MANKAIIIQHTLQNWFLFFPPLRQGAAVILGKGKKSMHKPLKLHIGLVGFQYANIQICSTIFYAHTFNAPAPDFSVQERRPLLELCLIMQ